MHVDVMMEDAGRCAGPPIAWLTVDVQYPREWGPGKILE
jgi:hypothetical protein